MLALRLFTRRSSPATARLRRLLDPDAVHHAAAAGRAGSTRRRRRGRGLRAAEAVTPVHRAFNVTGQPAVSVPLYWTADGLPIGMMLVGRPADEATLLSLSAQLEAPRRGSIGTHRSGGADSFATVSGRSLVAPGRRSG